MAQRERLDQIRATLREKERVAVSELSKQFHVTEETIRRDLEKLEAEGLITRTFGGAILNGRNTSARTSYLQRTQMNVAEKKTIARIAAGLIPKHRCVIGADSSSTVFETVCLLKGQANLILMTYAANILQALVDADMKIMSTGGLFNKESHSFMGVITRNTIKSYNTDILLISCKGLSLEGGLFDSDENEADIKQLMAKKAAKIILLADHTKFDNVAFAKLMDLEAIDVLVTDRRPSEAWVDALAASGVQLLYPQAE